MPILEYLESRRAMINESLTKFVESRYDDEMLRVAAYIAVGGKRLRGALTCLVCEGLGGTAEQAMVGAVAVEFVHAACLPETATVWGNPHPTTMAQMEPGKLVYSLDETTGTLVRRRVTAKRLSGYKRIYTVRTSSREVRATDNHPFLVYRQMPRAALYDKAQRLHQQGILQAEIARGTGIHRVTISRWLRGQNPPRNDLPAWMWVQLKDLKPGDRVVVCRGIPDEGVPYPIPDGGHLPYEQRHPTIASETSDTFMRWCGFVLGDGSISDRAIALYNTAPRLVDLYVKGGEAMFGLKAIYNKAHGSAYVFNSIRLARTLKSLGFEGNAHEKKVPHWVHTIPASQKVAFLRGYLDADGWVRKDGSYIGFASVSRELIYGIKLLCDQLGLKTGNPRMESRSRTWHDGHTTTTTIWILTGALNRRTHEVLGVSVRPKLQYDFGACRMRGLKATPEYWGFEKVRSITPGPEVPVYDIEVEGAHNFVADGVLVHNSLAHDDIADGDATRRGQPAAWSTYGVLKAIMIPHVMIPHAALFISQYGLRAMWSVIEHWSQITQGQIHDMPEFQKVGALLPVAAGDYERIIGQKTGAGFEIAAELGARAVRQDWLVRPAQAYGYALGLAFQVADDACDLLEKQGHAWESLGKDGKVPVSLRALRARLEAGETITEQDAAGAWDMAMALVAKAQEHARALPAQGELAGLMAEYPEVCVKALRAETEAKMAKSSV